MMTGYGSITSDHYDFVTTYFKTLVEKGVPVRVIKIEFDVETGAFETASEITADLAVRMV